jgi:hypothetical protein
MAPFEVVRPDSGNTFCPTHSPGFNGALNPTGWSLCLL